MGKLPEHIFIELIQLILELRPVTELFPLISLWEIPEV